MDLGLKGKVAMVTGAAQGIGSETARLLSYEGCKVAIADINFEKAERKASEIQAAGCEAMAFQCDVSEAVSVIDKVKKVREALGGIDILVNNAGVAGPYVGKLIVDMPEDHWDRIMSVHLRGTFLCTKYVAPLMIARRWGRIINVGSIHGISGGRPGLANYSSAKAGIEGFTKAASFELAPHGVTVNCVIPGFTRTAMSNPGSRLEETKIRQTPVGRLAESEDIAHAIVFIASRNASHITGASVRVDGGRFCYYLEPD